MSEQGSFLTKMNRRQFISTTAAGTLGAATILGNARAQSDKIKLGLIGAGWYGMVDVKAAFKVGGVECIAN